MFYSRLPSSFPSVTTASPEGLLAVGGKLSIDRLLEAYHKGIFPWYEEGEPVLWWSPDPRMVLFPEKLKVSKSLRKIIKQEVFQVTFNRNFREVMLQCGAISRKGQQGTWITPEMIIAYENLHKIGHAFSVEVWKNQQLVGGLYGVNLKSKKVFCGESMFSKESNASKVGFYFLVQHLIQLNYKLIDCQIYTSHLASFGAEEIERAVFLSYLTARNVK